VRAGQNVTVTGEAVDLDADKTAGETLEQVKARTADSEKQRFEAVTAASFDGKPFRRDGITSAFGEAWIDAQTTWLVRDARGAQTTWLVRDARGAQKYLVELRPSQGTVALRIKPVK
jgi:hypothetical protein